MRALSAAFGQPRRKVDPRVPARLTVPCRDGEAWITQDGDPRDVVLQASQSCTADRGKRMTVHALKGDCVLESEVGD